MGDVRIPTLIGWSIAWLLGIALAAALAPPSWLCWLLLLAIGSVGLAKHHSLPPRMVRWTAVCCFGLAGALRYQLADGPLARDHIAQWNERGQVMVRGQIVAEPDVRDTRTDYRVAVEAVRVGATESTADAKPADEWQPARGLLLVQAARYPLHAYGEGIIVQASLETPPALGQFDYRTYLARQGIHSLARRPRIATVAAPGGNPLTRMLIAVKARARGVLETALPAPESALAAGILLGDERGIPANVDAAFRTTNTTHIIAISGSNIALLVSALMATLGRLLGRRRAVPAVLATLALYTLLVGADAAVVRAAIMGGLMVLAGPLGRRGDAATALFAAGFFMTAYRPYYLWDLGFQLSFAATLGLILLADRLKNGLTTHLANRTRLGAERAAAAVGLVNEAVLITLAAQLATWPIIAYQTGQVSLVGLLANCFILPAQPAVMLLGALTTVAGMIWEPAGRAMGAIAWLPIAYTIRIVELAARAPFAAVAWQMNGYLVALYFGALGALLHPRSGQALRRIGSWRPSLGSLQSRSPVSASLSQLPFGTLPSRLPLDSPPSQSLLSTTPSRPSRHTPPSQSDFIALPTRPFLGPPPPPILLALAAVCTLAWVAALGRPDGLLHFYALDVGQGDALLVVSPNGRRMLVDGGPSPSAVLDGLGRHLPPWDRRLDVTVLTHPDADHVGGLAAVLGRYQVGYIVDPEMPAKSPEASAWADAASREGARVMRADAGERVILDEAAGVNAEVLWPREPRLTSTDSATNNNGVVLRLTYGRIAILLTADVEKPVEEALLASGAPLRSDVLKVAHHGSHTSTTPDFLRAVGPGAAVISLGIGNRYGHPAPETLATLAAAHIPVWRTDRQGTVEVVSDGQGVWVR